ASGSAPALPNRPAIAATSTPTTLGRDMGATRKKLTTASGRSKRAGWSAPGCRQPAHCHGSLASSGMIVQVTNPDRARHEAAGDKERTMAAKRRWRRAAGVAAISAMLASACSGSAGHAGNENTPGGILRIGTSYPIDSLNPFVGQSDYTYMTFEYVYPALTQYSAGLSIVPSFAVSWSESADGLTWTFKTRPNAKWSDGQPLTAADAAWTINMEKKYENGPTASAAGALA